jgi:ribosomal protein S18 acetylase RimI-like enzyme
VAVSPLFQGRGFGRALLAHAEQMAIAAGLPEIRLHTNKLFAANVRLYEKLGYRLDQEEGFRGGVVLHMSKPISL